MNWMQAAVRRLAWKTLMLGACAGLWAAFLAEAALVASGKLGAGAPLRTAAAALALGLAAGALVASIGEMLARHSRRKWAAMALGGAAGLLTALAGSGVAVWWPAFAAPLDTAAAALMPAVLRGALLAAFLGLAGGAIGLASGWGGQSRGLMARRFRYGLAGGLLAGIPAGIVCAVFTPGLWVFYALFSAWSAVLALALFVTEKHTARRWLRVLTGPGEDEFFPLVDSSIRLGKLEQNEIPLLRYNEVYPVHCRVQWAGDHYRIIDDETGGPVYVNFRQVQDQPLKPGDLIKIGSALLQYGEAAS